ncbi:dihydrofolate reductase [Xinfangfangia sp. D13-10-4-6]|uniref:dihydrofolate reductase n=1 Tax=Pseudogemmobacter hezensis TaxID=2737662 RepID=UPI001555BD8E|nr:dihydrofolate reductase [Pseudogemmobacter hezensis]NPD13950.1 dihydrofolate reductase [Pseudogemmobacter hezensis]
MLSLIVARSPEGAIGRDGDIPWHAPEDLAFFKRETLGGAVIMGRRTWESLPFKPLKNRDNIVVSTTMSGDFIRPSFAQALEHAKALGHSRIYAIGGASIYAAALPLADRLLITEVDVSIKDADTFFPAFPPEAWIRKGSLALRAADPACRLDEYLRLQPQPSS